MLAYVCYKPIKHWFQIDYQKVVSVLPAYTVPQRFSEKPIRFPKVTQSLHIGKINVTLL